MILGRPQAPEVLLELKEINSFTKSIKVGKWRGGSALKLLRK